MIFRRVWHFATAKNLVPGLPPVKFKYLKENFGSELDLVSEIHTYLASQGLNKKEASQLIAKQPNLFSSDENFSKVGCNCRVGKGSRSEDQNKLRFILAECLECEWQSQRRVNWISTQTYEGGASPFRPTDAENTEVPSYRHSLQPAFQHILKESIASLILRLVGPRGCSARIRYPIPTQYEDIDPQREHRLYEICQVLKIIVHETDKVIPLNSVC